MPKVVITAGEPAGIGPDLCAMLAQRLPDADITVIADRHLLESRAELLGLSLNQLNILHLPLVASAVPGQLNPANSSYVLETLRIAATGCINGEFDAMVTAPVHKGIINDAGIPFTGHTEFLAELTATPQVVMMLVGGGMRVALVTTHLPLRAIVDTITPELLEHVIRILHADLVSRFRLAKPRILIKPDKPLQKQLVAHEPLPPNR